MCTAVTYRTKDFYFGRNLDYEHDFGEEIVITPRNYPISFREMGTPASHYAIIGMARVEQGYPLYFDGINEKGLGMAGLNFVGNAHYEPPKPGRDNVASFELIPWILGQCETVSQAGELLGKIRITDAAFVPELPPSQLHWIIADREGAITVEAVKEGLRVYDNPVGVLTNNPTFDQQMFRLNDYLQLSPGDPLNLFAPGLDLKPYSRGWGQWDCRGSFFPVPVHPGAFVKMNSRSGESEEESVSQFFHILGAVEQQRGCCEVGDGAFEITQYTSCCNAHRGVYYYTTYENSQITAVDMHREALDGSALVRYPLIRGQQIKLQN